MRRIILLLVILGASPCRAETPKLFREEPFTCATLAEAANYYIALGEEATVKELVALTSDKAKDFQEGSRSRPELVRAFPGRKMLVCRLFRRFLLNSGTRYRLPPRQPSWPSFSSMSSGCKPFRGRSIS